VWVDGCRLHENAIYIKAYEEGYGDKSIQEIIQEMVELSDFTTISLKKMYSHKGGAILINKKSPLLSEDQLNTLDQSIKR